MSVSGVGSVVDSGAVLDAIENASLDASALSTEEIEEFDALIHSTSTVPGATTASVLAERACQRTRAR